jgi:hypothetical protein
MMRGRVAPLIVISEIFYFLSAEMRFFDALFF